MCGAASAGFNNERGISAAQASCDQAEGSLETKVDDFRSYRLQPGDRESRRGGGNRLNGNDILDSLPSKFDATAEMASPL